MKRPLRAAAPLRRRWVALFAGAVALLIVSTVGVAPTHADTAQRFLDRLRSEGHYDLALRYLERAESDPLMSGAFRRRVATERLRTLAERADTATDPAARLTAWLAVNDELSEVRSGDAAAIASLTTDASVGVATASAVVARQAADAAKQATDDPATLKRVGDELAEARELLSDAQSRLVAEREPLKGVDPQSPEGRRRRLLGERLALVRLERARVLLERAETLADGGRAQREALELAATELGALYEKYQRYLVGLLAQLYEGRAQRLLGEKQLALAALDSLLAQPTTSVELRDLRTRAHTERLALRIDDGEPDRGRESAERWFADLSSAERSARSGLALQHELARATVLVGRERDDKRLLRAARESLKVVARAPTPRRVAARALLAELTAELGVADKAPETFADAYDAGREAMERIAAETDPADAMPDRREAYELLRLACRLTDADTDATQLARCRYWLAYLDWLAGRDLRAAVRAGHVARGEDDSTAQDGARLAMAAYDRLGRSSDDAAYGDALGRLANYVIDRWPGEDVARAASSVIVTTALRSNDAETAASAIAAAPAEQRPGLRLRLALARVDAADAGSDAEKALAQLADAFEAADKAGVDGPVHAAAALRLAEARLESGDREAARRLLGDRDDGAVADTLAGGDPTAIVAALRLAVRAWAAAPDIASGYLDRLAESQPAGPAGANAWLAVASDLRTELKGADDKRRDGLATTFAELSPRLDVSAADGDWNTRLWIAQTRLRMSEALAEAAPAADLLSAARETLSDLIARAEAEPGFAPTTTAVLAARLRLAECQRAGGEHADAFETLVAMLEQRTVMLDVQHAAAETLADWAEATGDATRHEQAIAGARPDASGKNLVWGYTKLAAIAARAAASDPRRLPLFFDAWLGVAKSRYASGMLASGVDRDRQLRKAANTIRALRRQHPELGGGARQAAFEELVAAIDRGLNTGS